MSIINNYKLIEFKLINRDDKYNLEWIHWSRIYEYPFVINFLESNYKNNRNNIKIHNTCWGFEGVHVKFKNYLDKNYNNINSDIKKSNYDNTFIFDITKSPPNNYIENFDVVINISTIEEINNNNTDIIKKLFKQVKKNGYLIITFDYRKDISGFKYNSIDLKDIEKIFNAKCQISNNDISGLNSEKIEPRNKLLNCGVLIIKKL
mgnify:CR=1 FL=1